MKNPLNLLIQNVSLIGYLPIFILFNFVLFIVTFSSTLLR
ncbi:hypothetical protein H1P_5180001 [Hyella patelloides LEGE 07179]|uniref:Uncharacterized protein n=1 Tax=Hyella patelloides LEGE 07179 TaxID=945734 RepID=A0A563VZS1_9CYAN|nr:hypothetical protein H1P_5180001 [Hyella patelloides LEGE 07179]